MSLEMSERTGIKFQNLTYTVEHGVLKKGFEGRDQGFL